MGKKVKKSKRSALKPAFSHWHKQLMRIRLNAYKLNSGYEGWIDVADNIICSETNAFNFPADNHEHEKWLDAKHAGYSSGKIAAEKLDTGWPIGFFDVSSVMLSSKQTIAGLACLLGKHGASGHCCDWPRTRAASYGAGRGGALAATKRLS